MPMHYDHEFIPAARSAARPAAAAAAPGRYLRLGDQQDRRGLERARRTPSSSSGRTAGAARCARSWCTSSSRSGASSRSSSGSPSRPSRRCCRRARRPASGLRRPARRPGPPQARGSGRRGRGVLAGRGAVLRCPARAHLGVLAPGAPHGPPPCPGRCRPPPAGGPRAAHLRPHGGRLLDRRRPDDDPGRGAPTGGIMQQQRRGPFLHVMREVRHG